MENKLKYLNIELEDMVIYYLSVDYFFLYRGRKEE
jgi:hypothetical protein